MMRRLHRIQRDANNTLGSSGPVPIVQDTQGITSPLQTSITIPEEETNMEDENEKDDANFTPRCNPRRKVTRNSNYTSKNYALVGLNSEETDILW